MIDWVSDEGERLPAHARAAASAEWDRRAVAAVVAAGALVAATPIAWAGV